MPSNLPVPLPLPVKPLPTDSTISSKPKRKIFTAADLEPWFSSRAYADLEAYTLQLCHSVRGTKIEDECFESEVTRKSVAFLKEAEGWIDDIPLQTTPQRFGNKAFRDWLIKVKQRNDDFQNSLVATSSDLSAAASSSILPELSFNFITSFGSGPRLDYGTGHELSFVLWLLALRLIGILSPRDDQAVVLRIFASYLDLVRKLQKVFKLEPAGSKGVWGLDDHQHLSYLFGASQLIDHPTLRPSHILQPRILAPLANSYLLPSSILHIHALKSGPFSEHSPLLHQIASTVPNWAKVENGLWKMYREEVLAKVPVVQHLRFGGLREWRHRDTGEELPSTGDGREDDDDDEKEEDSEQDGNSDDSGLLKAPWAQGSQSNSSTSSTYPLSTNSAPLSHAAARRTPYTVSSVAAGPKPTSFAPPTLFPSRSSASSSRNATPIPGKKFLAEEGSAAAQSSPFGILASTTSNGSSTSGEPGGTRSQEAGVQHVDAKAPWAK
ncbi:serine/threonine-protein phosphatase 2A activator [Sporobolomyces salmoneus]|uniref:serine/threonine-protein phosphatase 2A activator n=1 Tax=Sporobolomyces salmoneus TaxID=183962 RepID=UPI00317091B5